jgi:hypothetical protein
MTTSRLALLALLSCSSLGCVNDADPNEPFDADLDEAPVVDRAGEMPAVCSRRVHIARRDGDGSCPDTPNGAWQGQQLFANATPWLVAHPELPLPGELGDYCRYTWQPEADPTAAQIDALYGWGQLDAVSPDCQAIAPESDDPLSDALKGSLQKVFFERTDRTTAADLGLGGGGAVAVNPVVTVLVVDTQPRDATVTPNSQHGHHMGNIIRDIACPDDAIDCRVEVEYALGLPRLGGGVPNHLHGGYVGTFADVAGGIHEGVRRWQAANLTRPPTKLVINMSFGWEATLYGGIDDSPAAVEAIHAALQFAACHGALVIGSAGNKGDLCDVSGPVMPSAWENEAFPDQARCSELGVPAMVPPAGLYQPLVNAVGALGMDDQPLVDGRAGANPRLLAPSTHAVAGVVPQGVLTGSSVAAAVTSGTAALLWAYRPGLAAGQVMGRIYAAASPLPGTTADFSLDGTTPGLRRVNACATVQAACAEPGASCPATFDPQCDTNAAAPTLEDLHAELSLVTPDLSVNLSPTAIDQTCSDACGNQISLYHDPAGPVVCGDFYVDPTDKLVNPTPGTYSCTTCGIDSYEVVGGTEGRLSLALDSEYYGVTIDAARATLEDEFGNKLTYDLGSLGFDVGQRYVELTLEAGTMPPGRVIAGELMIDFDSRRATTDRLIVY